MTKSNSFGLIALTALGLIAAGSAAGFIHLQRAPLKPMKAPNASNPDDILEGLNGTSETGDQSPEGTNPTPDNPADVPVEPPVVIDPPVLPDPVQPVSENPIPTAQDDVFVHTKAEDLAIAHHITTAQMQGFYDKFLQDSESVIIFDARKLETFEAGHIPGSICMPIEAFSGQQPELLMYLPINVPVVIYCAGGNCDESDAVRDMLLGPDYANIFVYHDGWPGWVASGGVIETGLENDIWADYYTH